MEHGAMTVPFTPAATKKSIVPDEGPVTDAHHLRWVYNLPLQIFQSSNSAASGKSFLPGNLPFQVFSSQHAAGPHRHLQVLGRRPPRRQELRVALQRLESREE
ncbi:hypothetical protein ACFXTO_035492 [Malus domestica]